MTNEADVRKEASGKRRWPVGDKQIATAEHHSQQHVEKGEPVPPADHLGDFFSVGLTKSHHILLFVILSALDRR